MGVAGRRGDGGPGGECAASRDAWSLHGTQDAACRRKRVVRRADLRGATARTRRRRAADRRVALTRSGGGISVVRPGRWAACVARSLQPGTRLDKFWCHAGSAERLDRRYVDAECEEGP